MHQLVRRLFKEADGQDIVEYAFLATFVAIASFTILISIGGNVGGLYEKVNTTVASANQATGGAGPSDPGGAGAPATDPGRAMERDQGRYRYRLGYRHWIRQRKWER